MNAELNLLFLEDDPADAELLQTLLKRAGLQFKGVVASDEAEFLQAMMTNEYHAVLADNALPQYSSLEALKMIRNTNPHVAFILVTGTVSEEFAVKIIQQGADDYILKTNLTRLPSAIINAIEKKKIQRQKEIAEQETEKEKELSISIINSFPGIFYICESNGKFLRWNKNFERISGYTASEIKKVAIEHFFSGKQKEFITKYLKKSFAIGFGETEAIFVTKEEKKIPYYFTSKAVNFEQKDCLICVGLDISSTKQTEIILKQLNDELHHVSAHLERIKEEEQARIAREVHDQLGQQLTGLKMDVSWLEKKGEQIAGTDEWKNKLKEMKEMLNEAVRTVRKIAYDLRPSLLDDFGLVAAMEWHGDDFSNRSGIAVQFLHPEINLETEPAIAIGLFRVYQEILTNVARHAEAKNIKATLEVSDNEIVLVIADDGKGFDSNKEKKSLGLLGMKERAYIIGGSLDIHSKPGKGTSVTVRVPLVK
ncbi:MAG: response regulator [Chitinophagaceae bacterium]